LRPWTVKKKDEVAVPAGGAVVSPLPTESVAPEVGL